MMIRFATGVRNIIGIKKFRFVLIPICFILIFYLFLLLLPFPELRAYKERSYGTVILDRNGNALRVLTAADGVKREWASLSEIPPGAVKIFIQAEDRRFYFHFGVDIFSIAGSFARNTKEQRIVSGASTITMQLARLIRPASGSGGFSGKIREAWDALRLEAKLSKKEILEMWLNNIPFGSNIEGLPAMSRARFGRSVNQIDENRAALLAAVPRRPGYYDPAINQEAAVSAAMALSKRCRLNLREEHLRKAVKEVAQPLLGPADPRAPFLAPHFTERIAAMLPNSPQSLSVSKGLLPSQTPSVSKGLLPSQTSAASAKVTSASKSSSAPKELKPPGRITTTLDLGLQRYAEEELAMELSLLSRHRVSNGAILAIENKTGAVRVYVGSGSWFDESISGKIDGVRFRGQPGSCLKPFLYAMALDKGFSPADIMPDIPTVFGSREAYIPSNFNNRFNGPVRFRIALASSLNIPAVYLLERLGVGAFEEYLINLGFDSIKDKAGTHGTGLALGNAEVSLEEMVRGFSSFPGLGVPAKLLWSKEENALSGNAILNTSSSGASGSLMSSYAAWIITDILSDKASRFVGFGPAPSLATPFASMFKTGTANQFQHIWALGATRHFTVGVWMGNFSGETVIGSTGSSTPARIAAKLLAALEQTVNFVDSSSDVSFDNLAGALPSTISQVRICALSGMAEGKYCTGHVFEWIQNNSFPERCTWHTSSGLFYPPEYRSWITERFRSGSAKQEGNGRIRIPASGSIYYMDPSLPRNAQALRIETSGFGAEAFVYVNGVLAGSLNHAGVYAFPLSKGIHSVFVEDSGGSSASVNFEIR